MGDKPNLALFLNYVKPGIAPSETVLSGDGGDPLYYLEGHDYNNFDLPSLSEHFWHHHLCPLNYPSSWKKGSHSWQDFDQHHSLWQDRAGIERGPPSWKDYTLQWIISYQLTNFRKRDLPYFSLTLWVAKVFFLLIKNSNRNQSYISQVMIF